MSFDSNSINRNRLKTKRGDTLIEVLLAIAIVGTVLGATFVSANRSLRGMQQARDRSEATTLVNSAITAIKQDRSKAPTLVQLAAGGTKYLDNNLSMVDSSVSIGTEERYIVSISRGSVSDDSKYSVMITWESIMQNTELETIKLDYWAAE